MKKNDDQMNLLKEHNQKEYRIAMQKERRKDAFQEVYQLVRNVVLAGIIIGVGIYFAAMWYFQELPIKEIDEFDQAQVAEIITEITRPLAYHEVGFRMYSQYALLINLSTGRILFEHQADVQAYPASLTKMMTVLIGIEQGTLTDRVTVQADFDELFRAGLIQSGFRYGEVRTLSEILHGIMLPSGAESTWALAYHIAGSYEAFVALMNEKAMEIGMYDTHFVTATGLHDENHYTTAHDMAILLQYALENPVFKEIFTARTYELETPNSQGSTLYSTLFRAAPRTTFEGGEIIGGRTGFTTPAGRCLASLATDGTDEFILITFGAPDPDFTNQNAHILDALTIYEYFLAVRHHVHH
ncbi:MAG: D-alanyl-D-alanine carboxypeptidase [Defluviitaleaceae bacterium]|nr:D-alanyl-D-alanine carboxypeptidase [Defluviitaleaceae bacterium]